MTDAPMPTSFQGARLTGVDFSGAVLRDCDLRNVKIVDSWLIDVDMSGLIGNIVVNEVDVTEYVNAELDRRHPERVQLRGTRTPEDHRAMWSTIEARWSTLVERAAALSEDQRQQRVDDEWSFVETLRHLIFCTDAWVSRTVLDDPLPYDRLGYSHSSYPSDDAAALGIDLAARPSFAEVLAVRRDRMAVVRRIVDGLSEVELERECMRNPAPGYPEQPRTVRTCLSVVMGEEIDHANYAARDLTVLEAQRGDG